MLNWAARYYPIIRVLKDHDLYRQGSLLEVGSGSIGIGRFRKVPFVGCDIRFPSPARWPMTPVIASAAQLPMADREFDVVLASDVLEHVPPDLRTKVISECLRVARKIVIFGFPCGAQAWRSDQLLLSAYTDARLSPPDWLTEHMEAMFPEADLFGGLAGWNLRQFGNENIGFHSWLMRREMSGLFVRASSLAMRAVPFLVEAMLRKADRPPFYRQIFILERRVAQAEPEPAAVTCIESSR